MTHGHNIRKSQVHLRFQIFFVVSVCWVERNWLPLANSLFAFRTFRLFCIGQQKRSISKCNTKNPFMRSIIKRVVKNWVYVAVFMLHPEMEHNFLATATKWCLKVILAIMEGSRNPSGQKIIYRVSFAPPRAARVEWWWCVGWWLIFLRVLWYGRQVILINIL